MPPKIPTDVEKFTGEGKPTLKSFFSDLNSFFSFHPPGNDQNKVKLAAMVIAGTAKEWYCNSFDVDSNTNKTYAEFERQLRAHFTVGDVNLISRREQKKLRIVPQQPLNLQASVTTFVHKFMAHQVNIHGQGTLDAYLLFIECIAESITDYNDVAQLESRLSIATSTLAEDERTAAKVAELAIQHAAEIRSTTGITTSNGRQPSSLHAMGYNQPTQQYAGNKRQRADGRMSYMEARRQGVCTYCKNRNANHKSVRAYNPATGKYDGDIICDQLKNDIASGRVQERVQYRRYNNNNNNPSMSLNSSGSRQVTHPAAKQE